MFEAKDVKLACTTKPLNYVVTHVLDIMLSLYNKSFIGDMFPLCPKKWSCFLNAPPEDREGRQTSLFGLS